MTRTRCRWHLVDLGGFRRARFCRAHDHWAHPWACFEDGTGLLACCCGIATSRSRPVAPKEEAIA